MKNHSITYCRNFDVLSKNQDLETIYTIKDFPVFMGSTYDDISNDLFVDLNFQISKSSGLVQINPLVNLDIVYKETHNPGKIGNSWKMHHQKLSDFINKFNKSKVIEIGGYSGILADLCLQKKPNYDWHIIDPHVTSDNKNIKIINEFFDKNFNSNQKYDLIVHSHLLEHIIEPNSFLEKCYEILNDDGLMIFSVPNLKLWLSNNFTNCMTFEHTFFLDDHFCDKFLEKNGFEIIEKNINQDCSSIFYAAKKNQNMNFSLENKYQEYKTKFEKYFDKINDFIKTTNEEIQNSCDVFLFGGHVTTQYLIKMGLNIDKISCILDNDSSKQNKRLYGTNITIKSPNILKDKKKPIVILKISFFDKEISEQIYLLNPNTKILTF